MVTCKLRAKIYKPDTKEAVKHNVFLKMKTFTAEGKTELEALDNAGIKCAEYCKSKYSYSWVNADYTHTKFGDNVIFIEFFKARKLKDGKLVDTYFTHI